MSCDEQAMDDGRDPLAFLGGRIPASFELRVVVVAPGCERAYLEGEWRDALVVVERGEIGLVCVGGACRYFRCGDALWLVGLPLRALNNRGNVPAVLVAISRRTSDTDRAGDSLGGYPKSASDRPPMMKPREGSVAPISREERSDAYD